MTRRPSGCSGCRRGGTGGGGGGGWGGSGGGGGRVGGVGGGGGGGEGVFVGLGGGGGLDPAGFWLGEDGLALSTSTWKGVFADANVRCARAGVALRCHAHMLRHTFAVVTLEQLQRGHVAALAELNAAQRGHYTRVFGDPLDWVRRRLGHRSLTTTMVYLHALAELEMHTRMALVPDGWEDPS